jgi:hypothetical protein
MVLMVEQEVKVMIKDRNKNSLTLMYREAKIEI